MKRAALPAAAGAAERIAEVYAGECSRAYGRAPCEAAVARFVEAYQGRDYFALEYAFNGLNPGARKAFAILSGLALPAGQAAGREVLRRWAGIPQELIELRAAAARVELERGKLERTFRNVPGLAEQSVDWIGARIASGMTILVKRLGHHYLVNEAGEGVDLSRKSSGLNQLRPMIEAMLAHRACEAAYTRVAAQEEAPGAVALVDCIADPFRM